MSHAKKAHAFDFGVSRVRIRKTVAIRIRKALRACDFGLAGVPNFEIVEFLI